MSLTFFVTSWPGRIVALALGVGVIFGALNFVRGGQPAATAAPRTATVTRGSVTQTVSVSGSVNASGQARLSFKSSGRLANVSVSVGQSVVAGQALATLDTTDLQTALSTAQQNLASAQASYQKQVLASNDTRAQLDETQRSTANDIASAQATLTKVRTNYASAKSNFVSLTNAVGGDVNAYRSVLDTLRTQIQQVLTDLPISGNADMNSARNSLNNADATLLSAQGYPSGVLTSVLNEYLGARDSVVRAYGDFDAAVEAGNDPSSGVSSYQSAQLVFNLSLSRLQAAFDALTTPVGSAQQQVSAAVTSLNTQAARSVSAYDQARADLAIVPQTFIQQSISGSAAKTKLTQTATFLTTINDAVSGALVNATTAVAAAQDRAATSIRQAQSAVANIPFNLQSAQTSVDNAANSVANAQSNLDAAILTAPSAGIVASIANQVGEFVGAGGAASNAGFIVLTNTTSLVLHGTVGEADVSKLKIGQVANITIDALTGQKMTGKVTSLDPVATIQQGVPVYGIDVTIDVPATTVKAGMSGTAAVIIASKQNVLIVPNTAIRSISGQRGLSVLKDGETVDTVAQFGLSNDTSTEVVSGVAEGDVVVIPQARTGTATARPGGGFGGGGGGVIVGPGR